MRTINTLFGALLCSLLPISAFADLAVLVDEGVLVEINPEPTPLDQGQDPITQATIGVAKNASYVSDGSWAVTSLEFIDKAAFVFDFGSANSVSGATLILPVEAVYPQAGTAPIKLEFFSDNGVVEYTDYTVGFPESIGQADGVGQTEIRFDVTGAVNAVLSASRYVGFRVLSTLEPSAVVVTSPKFTGVKFLPAAAQLEFVPGAPPATSPDSTSFNGFTMEVPKIEIATIGEVYAQFKLIDVNAQIYQLTAATITGAGSQAPLVSGRDLFDCNAFSAPVGSAALSTGSSTYSINSGIIDIPDVAFNGNQFSVRMEYIEGTNPLLYELLDFREISTASGNSGSSDLDGGLITEPSQDFIPACHGWIIIGDSVRNRIVERNVISGETGKVYPFNTVPDQLTLDEANGLVYFTVHPEATRLYKLDLNTGTISNKNVKQLLAGAGATYTYPFALRDIVLGENGNLFALMIDPIQVNPENSIPYASSGKWLGLFDTDANFLTQSLPLLEPIRIEYDPVKQHVFLATESNLATFNFNPVTNTITFVNGTDVQVGSGCTDFSISPDGNRLAYSCPAGNNKTKPETSIWDMDPLNYFNIDGEWLLEEAPISATFNQAGTILIATDNTKLYFFDVVTHLLLEDFKLGLLEGETVKRIRFSKDGNFIIFSLANDTHIANSKFLYMKTPALTGTPLP